MLEYIKMIILSVVCGITAPLPVSSAAHYSVLANAMSLTTDEAELGFYFSLFGITFSVVAFIIMRRIYIKSIRAFFTRDKEKLDNKKLTAYKPIMKNILLSLLPTMLLFIPTGKNTLVIDYFDKFLGGNNLYLVGFACLINALIIVVAIWYTRQPASRLRRVSDTRSTIRMSFYQLVSYIIPGFSHVASGGVNMLISDVSPKVVIREVYLYLAPQMLLVSVVRLLRALFVGGAIIDLVTVFIAVVVFGIFSAICIYLVGKFNVRRIFAFFSVYSVFMGVAAVVAAFII